MKVLGTKVIVDPPKGPTRRDLLVHRRCENLTAFTSEWEQVSADLGPELIRNTIEASGVQVDTINSHVMSSIKITFYNAFTKNFR
jgi:hypothetical protein